MRYEEAYAGYVRLVERALDAALTPPAAEWPEEGIPAALNEAMRYSLLGGGKRLRPVLLLAAHSLLSSHVEEALPFAAAIEMIHSYSLIHDDLPAMDDDDLRRGRPTSHKAFGEATAILAGDALLTLAFETMASSGHPRALAAMKEIAARSGARGMIAGQAADMAMEGKTAEGGMLRYIHRHKTADLITAAVLAGLCLGGAGDEQLALGRAYGQRLGLAFQIVDDILDVVGDEAQLGKQTHQDARQGKLTWPAAHGLEQARQAAQAEIAGAMDAAAALDRPEGFLWTLAQRMQHRAS